MTAVIGFAGRIQAQQLATSSAASSFSKGVQVPTVVARSQRIAPSRNLVSSIKAIAAEPAMERPDSTGRFGKFGGKYVPETLISALAELEQAYAEAMNDPKFTVSLHQQCWRFLKPPTCLAVSLPHKDYPSCPAGRAQCAAQGLCRPSFAFIPRR